MVEFLERGADVETDVLSNIKTVSSAVVVRRVLFVCSGLLLSRGGQASLSCTVGWDIGPQQRYCSAMSLQPWPPLLSWFKYAPLLLALLTAFAPPPS